MYLIISKNKAGGKTVLVGICQAGFESGCTYLGP